MGVIYIVVHVERNRSLQCVPTEVERSYVLRNVGSAAPPPAKQIRGPHPFATQPIIPGGSIWLLGTFIVVKVSTEGSMGGTTYVFAVIRQAMLYHYCITVRGCAHMEPKTHNAHATHICSRNNTNTPTNPWPLAGGLIH